MDFIVLVVSFLLAAFGLAHGTSLLREDWETFKRKYDRKFQDAEEESIRMGIFARTRAEVERINTQQLLTFKTKINRFSDRTEAEMKQFKGFHAKESDLERSNSEGRKFLQRILNSQVEIPEELDWRRMAGRVTDVKDQGSCGSCWAFSSIGTLEGQMTVRNLTLLQLSEQNLIDCSRHNGGCVGGLVVAAWNDIGDTGGIESNWMYPYRDREEKCSFNKTNAIFNTKGGTYLTRGNEEELKRVVALFGPVSVAYDAHSFTFRDYSSGVYYGETCRNSVGALDHAMVVVGYGTDPVGGPYWICKNSWGKDFGQDGYIKVARNRGNNCGIATMAAIPYF